MKEKIVVCQCHGLGTIKGTLASTWENKVLMHLEKQLKKYTDTYI